MSTAAPARPIPDRIAAGVALLDRFSPTWVDNVDLDQLDIDCEMSCVLGQVYGDYLTGLRALGIGQDDALLFGFADGRDWGEIDYTTPAWRNRIEARRAVA